MVFLVRKHLFDETAAPKETSREYVDMDPKYKNNPRTRMRGGEEAMSLETRGRWKGMTIT